MRICCIGLIVVVFVIVFKELILVGVRVVCVESCALEFLFLFVSCGYRYLEGRGGFLKFGVGEGGWRFFELFGI